MRRGRIVADDIDPKKTSVEEVERVITGMSEDGRSGNSRAGKMMARPGLTGDRGTARRRLRSMYWP